MWAKATSLASYAKALRWEEEVDRFSYYTQSSITDYSILELKYEEVENHETTGLVMRNFLMEHIIWLNTVLLLLEHTFQAPGYPGLMANEGATLHHAYITLREIVGIPIPKCATMDFIERV